MNDFSFDNLQRAPDVEAPNLFAFDATDRLLLDTAAGAITGTPEGVVVIGDHYGALTIGAAALHGARAIRTHQDPLSGERALTANAESVDLADSFTHHPLDEALLADARCVLLQLPRSLAALDEIAWTIACYADPGVTVFAGGRVKHMTTAMNGVLARHFGTVSAGLARQKSRILTASNPLPTPVSGFPVEEKHDVGLSAQLILRAFGSTFGAAKLDAGTRYLLPSLAEARAAGHAIDLGSGNGTIAAYLALTRPALTVTATDQSASAVSSSRATAEANGVGDRISAVRDDALSSRPASSTELIVLNPPFHLEGTVHSGIALKLFADAGRVLRSGGELWTVWNSHLQYRTPLGTMVGPTRQVARNPKFTVTVSTAR
ncbi:methyltransferase [Arthrobacter sp. H20]|uniref:class I SAM-dependent methyltransferase n=1 Tax=Arthrobacter sp. H20 TaxID=1267981 RepID=UPI00047BC927|nr:methyltransferase [Arthrobacter sp. H20]